MTEEYFKIAETRINQTVESSVTSADKQLSTQLPEGVQTTPNEKYEQGILEKIRNPDAAPKQKKTTTKKSKNVVNLFQDQLDK
jgi:hypothetical protein